ncbi:hypothetical protein [Streptomyces sp. NPDC054837]
MAGDIARQPISSWSSMPRRAFGHHCRACPDVYDSVSTVMLLWANGGYA